jgi:hypothetical protein
MFQGLRQRLVDQFKLNPYPNIFSFQKSKIRILYSMIFKIRFNRQYVDFSVKSQISKIIGKENTTSEK